ncbi:MAG: hypothetical protein ACOYL7_13740 [Caldilinea sp.]
MNCFRHLLRRRQWLATLFLAGLALLAATGQVEAADPCAPPNLLPAAVCGMDTFTGARPLQIPTGWSPFILYGSPEYLQDEHTFFGGFNLTIASTSPFKAGIFTQVQVTPGAGYRASIGWGAPNVPDLFGRQLGIDPTGGTDPNAPTVIWGPMHWGEGRILNYPPPDVNIDVRARAVTPTITIFFLADHPQSAAYDLILIDAISLFPDESAPAVELPPTATPTPAAEVKVAEAPAPLPPAATPTATPTAIPTETPTATPTAIPTVPPTAIPTATPTATLLPTATWTALPSATAEPLISLTKDQASRAVRLLEPRLLVLLSGTGLSGAVLLGVSWGWLRRRR